MKPTTEPPASSSGDSPGAPDIKAQILKTIQDPSALAFLGYVLFVFVSQSRLLPMLFDVTLVSIAAAGAKRAGNFGMV